MAMCGCSRKVDAQAQAGERRQQVGDNAIDATVARVATEQRGSGAASSASRRRADSQRRRAGKVYSAMADRVAAGSGSAATAAIARCIAAASPIGISGQAAAIENRAARSGSRSRPPAYRRPARLGQRLVTLALRTPARTPQRASTAALPTKPNGARARGCRARRGFEAVLGCLRRGSPAITLRCCCGSAIASINNVRKRLTSSGPSAARMTGGASGANHGFMQGFGATAFEIG